MDSLIEAFHIDWKIIIAQMVNFAIVFFVLWKFALKPLGKLMKERSLRIEQGLGNAKKSEEVLAQSREIYDEELSRARQEAQILMLEMKQVVDTKKAELLKKVEQEIQALMLENRKSMQFEKERIIRDAETSIVDLVKKSLEKVLGESVEGSIAEHVVHNTIEDIKNIKA